MQDRLNTRVSGNTTSYFYAYVRFFAGFYFRTQKS